jgi:carbon-monoxide dehydrogenase medium subunit
MTDIQLHQPASIGEATAILARLGDDARIIAGGTAVVLMLKNRLISPAALLSLGHLDELRGIHGDPDGTLHIGALATLREVERSPEVQAGCPTLADACRQVGNVRVRNAATIGGNISEADYASDPPCVLVAARARVRLASVRGTREVPLTEWFTDFYETAILPDEVVTELILPPRSPSTRSAYLKYVTRSSEDRPCLGTAAVVDLDDAGGCRELRVVVGSAAATPQEVESAEKLAVGQRLTPELIREIAEGYAAAIDPISDLRGSAWYRTQMVRVFVRDAIQQAMAGGMAGGME